MVSAEARPWLLERGVPALATFGMVSPILTKRAAGAFGGGAVAAAVALVSRAAGALLGDLVLSPPRAVGVPLGVLLLALALLDPVARECMVNGHYGANTKTKQAPR